MATSKAQRDRQRQLRKERRRSEEKLSKQNLYGNSDPTPFEAVGNIIRAQRDRETTSQHTIDLA